MGTIKLTIDGKEVVALEEQTVLEAALSAGIYIPHLCTHPDLPVQGNCNLCIVELGDGGKQVKACETRVAAGMNIATKSQALSKARNITMELILAGHPKDCTSCKVYLNCELQSLIQYLGTVSARMRHINRKAISINTRNPLIVREMERCVQCGRCVRACHDLRDSGVIDYKKLDWETYIGTESDQPLADSGCRFCGACIEVCPTGALIDAEGTFRNDIPRAEALVPCGAECPAKIDIPRYVRYIKNGEYSKATAVIREKAPYPHTLGYICNHRCETGCKRETLSGAISIRDLKRFAAAQDDGNAWSERYITSNPEKTGKTVAVIGSGPCGLTAAFYLNRKGHTVTVFERFPVAGGMMSTGIPEYRLPRRYVLEEIDVIRKSGVTIITDSNVTSATDLRSEYDAVLVATGAGGGKKPNLTAFAGSPDVFTAVELLRDVHIGKPIYIGNTVSIIGGGNVAYDCARTMLRMGKTVNIVCLEKGDEMPADKEEIKEGEEEGVNLFDGTVSTGLEMNGDKITGLRIIDVERFYFDENNSLITDTIEGTERVLPCDSIVFAAGQNTGLSNEFGIELNSFGYPVINDDGSTTSAEGVFAAGDVVTGTRFVIDAITGGRKAAAAIDRYLGGDGEIDESLIPYEAGEPKIGTVEGFAGQQRVTVETRLAGERVKDYIPVCADMDSDQASCEASRCLQCDLRKQITKVKLWTQYASRA